MAKPRSVENNPVETKRSQSCQSIAAIARHDPDGSDLQRE
jgi:hypothetical protein